MDLTRMQWPLEGAPGVVADDLGVEAGVTIDNNDSDANVMLTPGPDDGDARANDGDDIAYLLAGGGYDRQGRQQLGSRNGPSRCFG
jgi:hypothetical protein